MLLLRRSTGWAYLIAVTGTGIVLAVRACFPGGIGTLVTTFLYLLTVLAAGLVGGWKPALSATGLSMAGVILLFTRPRDTFWVVDLRDVVRLLPYLFGGAAISLLCEGLWKAWDRIAERQQQLEREIAERRKVEEHLREADRRKDEFLATLAHELRNPLAPLANAVQLWSLVGNDAAEIERLRDMMKRQLGHMSRLIDDLLDVSRINRGKIELQLERVDLAAVISAVIESVRFQAEAAGLPLSVTLPPEPLEVNADVTRLSQVIGNILNNAVKFTPPGGEISVSGARVGGNAVIRIRDSGCGIPREMLSRIFEMFEQVDRSLDRSQGGLGIGLMLVKRLVELHGGSIEAHSEGEGKGSEFVVTLPALAAPARRADVPQRNSAVPVRGELPRFRILVVDDVQSSADTLAMILRTLGQDVSTAYDGRTAVDWTLENKPEVVFLDIAMPGMNGYEAARRIRAAFGSEDLLLVALTGYGQEEDRRRSREAGFDRHLTKPVTVETLNGLLTDWGRAHGSANRSSAVAG